MSTPLSHLLHPWLFFYLNSNCGSSQLHMHLNAYSKRQIFSEIYLHWGTVQRPSYLKWKITFGLTLLHLLIFLVLWSGRNTLFQPRLNETFCAPSSSFTLFLPLFCYRISTYCNLIQFTLLFWFDAAIFSSPAKAQFPVTHNGMISSAQINHYFLLKLLSPSDKRGKQRLISWIAKLLGIQVFAAL